jgi:aminoglycoside phosphotransferase (APT) family kinase protein
LRGRLVGQGREAEIFEWGDGAVLRLMRDPTWGERARQQEAAMRAALEAGAPVPAVRELVEFDGRPGLVMDRVDGPAMMDALARAPWTLWSMARRLGDLHAKVNSIEAPPVVPDQREYLRGRIAEVGDLIPEHLRTWATEVLDGLPDGDRLCHGDYHVSNVLMGRSGPMVIDWTRVTRGHPTGDFARSLLLTHMGEVPPGTPFMIRLLRRPGQGLFNGAYERAYRRGIEVDDASLERWKVAQIAARFSERIEVEYPRLRRFLEARAPRSA